MSNPIEAAHEALDALIELLEDERAALGARDAAQLEVVNAQKLAVCQRLERTLAELPKPLPSDTRHKALLQRAAQAQDSNLVNGKIIYRSQQSIQAIIDTLNGKALDDGLYDTSGIARNDLEGNKHPIAKV